MCYEEYCSRFIEGHRSPAVHLWTSLAIHDRRSGKFERTSAFNKLWIREERASFGPPALRKLILVTSLAPKWQIHWRNILKMNDISTIWAQKISIFRSRRTIPLHLKIAKKRPFFVWKQTLSVIFWEPVTKSSNPPIEYVRLIIP